MGDLYLGLDLSTQSLKSVLIDQNLNLVHTENVVLDDMGFGTTDGFIDDGKTITAPALMFVKAVDTLFGKLKTTNLLTRVKSISASGQQHGTVYWKSGSKTILANLDHSKSLESQLSSTFSKSNCPIWMDSSTKEVCEKLTKSVGGPKNLVELTGSAAYERFSINQIFKFSSENPEAYAQTERVELISSFVISLLAGSPAPIDWADGSGMNCFDIEKKCWSQEVLNFGTQQCGAKNIEAVLGQAVASDSVVGNISSYWTERYNIPAACKLVAATGDNPSSFAGLNIGPGTVCLSLGTSDTVFMDMVNPRPQTEGHVFVNPVRTSSYMGMLCYKNGSLIRQNLRDEHQVDWTTFGEILEKTEPTNYLYIRYDFEEITPVLQGSWKFKIENYPVPISSIPKEFQIRALVETQIIAKRAHAQKFGFEQGQKVIVTGGASSNKQILQVIADVFQLDVYVNQSTANSAAMGAAYRAFYSSEPRDQPYDKIIQSAVKLELSAKFNPELAAHYQKLTEAFIKVESDLLKSTKTCSLLQ